MSRTGPQAGTVRAVRRWLRSAESGQAIVGLGLTVSPVGCPLFVSRYHCASTVATTAASSCRHCVDKTKSAVCSRCCLSLAACLAGPGTDMCVTKLPIA